MCIDWTWDRRTARTVAFASIERAVYEKPLIILCAKYFLIPTWLRLSPSFVDAVPPSFGRLAYLSTVAGTYMTVSKTSAQETTRARPSSLHFTSM